MDDRVILSDQSKIRSMWRAGLLLYLLTHTLSWATFASSSSLKVGLLLTAGLSILWWLREKTYLLSFLLCFFWAVLFWIEPLARSSEISVIGWLLLAIGISVQVEARRSRSLDRALWWAAWIVLSVLYFNSGLSKYFDEGWRSGQTLSIVLTSDMCRLPGLFRGSDFFKTLSLSVIVCQMVAPLMLLNAKMRWFLWAVYLIFHVLTLILLRVDQVSWAFLIYHFFLLDLTLRSRNSSES